MRAAVYCRVSSIAQKDRDTIASQKARLPEYVKRQGWDLVQTYVDDGLSAKAGKLDKRQAFTKLLRDTEAGKFDVVVVVDLDRLTRSDDLIERFLILGTFQRAGVQIAVESTGQLLDLKSSQGDLQATLGGYFSAEENRKRSERTKRGKEEAAKKGRKPAGPTPFGFTYDKTKPEPWGVDEDSAKWVRDVFERLASGQSCFTVAQHFDAKKVPRPRGGRWQRERIWAIANNRAYVGVYTVDKAKGITVAVPRIISDELWEKAHAALRVRRKYESRGRYVNLLERISRCGTCGGPIHVTGNSNGRRYYVCATKKAQGRGVDRCPNRMLEVTQTDERVWKAIVEQIERGDVLGAAAKKQSEKVADAKAWEKDIRSAELALQRVERQHEKSLALYARGKLSDADMEKLSEIFQRDQEQHRRDMAIAKQAIAAADRTKAQTKSLEAMIGRLRSKLHGATPEQRRDLVKLLVPGRSGYEVTLGPDTMIEVSGILQESIVQRDSDSSSGVSQDSLAFKLVT